MTTTQYQTLLNFYKQALIDSVAIEDELKKESLKAILELDEFKVKGIDYKDTQEYLIELNYLLDRLY